MLARLDQTGGSHLARLHEAQNAIAGNANPECINAQGEADTNRRQDILNEGMRQTGLPMARWGR
jgi:hypothetical protein